MTSLIMTADKIGWTLLDLYKRLDAWMKAKHAARNTKHELSLLSDYELKDIGLDRSQIGPRAYEVYKLELTKQLGGKI